MNSVQRDVSVRYALEYTDRGLARAVTTTRALEQASQKTGAAVTLASRRQSDAWRLLDRQARTFDTATTQRALGQGAAVSRSVDRQVMSLRKLGASYREITAISRAAGASADQTAVMIERAAAREQAAVEKLAHARATLRRVPAAVGGSLFGGRGGISERSAVREVRGGVRGAIGTGAGFLGGGLLGMLSVGGIKSAIESTKELAKETQFLTQVTGMDAKTVATRTEAALSGSKKMVAAFGQLGISSSDLSKRQGSVADVTDLITRRLAKMHDGVLKTTLANTLLGKSGGAANNAAAAFERLGITQKDLAHYAGNVSGLMGLVADRLNKVHGGSEKAALAAKLFGRNAAALWPILSEGSKKMEEQRHQAAAYGVALGKDPVKNAHALEEASYNLKLAQIGLEVQFSEHLAPALIKATTYGTKLAVTLGHDLKPAFHTLGPIVKDVGHWLKDHRLLIRDAVLAYAGFRVLKTVGGWMGGLYNDGKRLVNVIGAFKTVATEGIGSLFKQQSATDKLALSNDRLAASLERAALAQKGLAEATQLTTATEEEQALAGGLPGGSGGRAPRGRGLPAGERGLAGAAQDAQLLEQTVQTEARQTGLLGALFGKRGTMSLTERLGTIAKGAGTGAIGGFLGNQLGGQFGGMIGGKTGAGFGAAIGTGAGVGMMFGPAGAAAGAAIGAAVQGLHTLFGGHGPGDAAGKLQKEMLDAANAGNAKKLRALALAADKSAAQLRGIGDSGAADKFKKLAAGAGKTASALDMQRAATGVAGLQASIAGSRYTPSVSAIAGSTISTLRGVGRDAQNAGAAAMVQFTSGLERNRKLPVGSTNRLIADLERQYGPSFAQKLSQSGASSQQQISNVIARSKVIGTVQKQVDSMHKQWGLMIPAAKVTSQNVQDVMATNIEIMRQKVKHSVGKEHTDALAALKALLADQQAYAPLIRDAGTSGFKEMHDTVVSLLHDLDAQSGTTLKATLANIQTFFSSLDPQITAFQGTLSQLISTLNSSGFSPLTSTPPTNLPKKAAGGWVPGDPHRDGTLALLSGDEFVVTGHGQGMMESVAPGLLDHLAAHQMPHFQAGGYVDVPDTVGNMVAAGARGVASATSKMISQAKAAAAAAAPPTTPGGAAAPGSPGGPTGVGSYMGVPMANWVIESLRYAAAHGSGNPQPTSGYRPGFDPHTASGRSEHQGTQYPHGAVDFGGFNTGLAPKMAVVNATRTFKWPLLAPIGFHDDGHASGTGHRRGGYILPSFRGGGGVSFSGPVSTFGPPGEAAGGTAGGHSSSEAGLSLRIPGTHFSDQANRNLMGHVFRTTIAGHTANLLDFDLGPADWTGKNIDVTGAGVAALGIPYGSFPTGAIGTVTELGAGAVRTVGGGKGAKSGAKTVKQTVHSLIGLAMRPGQAFETGFQEGLIGHTTDALANAAAQAAIWKTTTKSVPNPNAATPGGAGAPPTGGRPARIFAAMMAAANHIMGRPYGHTGGHGVWEAGDYDCSGAVGYVLHAAGLQPGFGWTGTDQNWGAPGPGKYITRALRNPGSQPNGHEMLKFFGKYFESGGGGPLGQHRVHWDSGWDGAFTTFRHPPGLRGGGYVNNSGLRRNHLGHPINGDEAAAKTGRRPFGRFRTGGPLSTNMTRLRTGTKQPAHMIPHTPVAPAQGLYSIAPSTNVPLDVKRLLDAGFNNRIALAAITRIAHAFDQVHKYSERRMENIARHYEKLLAHLKHIHAPRMEQRRIATVLALAEGEIGRRAGLLVKASDDLVDPVQRSNNVLSKYLASSRGRIDLASTKWLSVLASAQQVPEKAMRTQIADLEKAYRIAQRQHNKTVMAAITTKLSDAMANLRAAVETRFQGYVDAATHATTMAQAGQQNLQLREQLSGSFGTPGAGTEQASYITSTIIPSLKGELSALTKQQAAAKKLGDTALANQIAEAIAGKQNDILQAQLDAQTAIKDNTQQTAQNTQTPLTGQVGISFEGQTLPDLAGLLNGV